MQLEERENRIWAMEINEEESDEICAELFDLCCKILDGAPDANDLRKQLGDHVKHVRECRKGSCAVALREGGIVPQLKSQLAQLNQQNRELQKAFELSLEKNRELLKDRERLDYLQTCWDEDQKRNPHIHIGSIILDANYTDLRNAVDAQIQALDKAAIAKGDV
jgi:hypothetical protein